MTDQTPIYPLPTAQVQVYVDVLGMELTIKFLLAFGGAELTLGNKTYINGQLAQTVGLDLALQLCANAHLMQRRVPLAKPWLSKCLYAEGLSKAAIARRLHVSDVSVRKWLQGVNAPSNSLGQDND